MKLRMFYEISELKRNGIWLDEKYDNYDEARSYFEKIRDYEPAKNSCYFLNSFYQIISDDEDEFEKINSDLYNATVSQLDKFIK